MACSTLIKIFDIFGKNVAPIPSQIVVEDRCGRHRAGDKPPALQVPTLSGKDMSVAFSVEAGRFSTLTRLSAALSSCWNFKQSVPPPRWGRAGGG